MKKPIYKNIFTRHHPLALIEIWSQGESIDPKKWTTKKQPSKPYIIFENDGETVHCYMDPAGVRWMKDELFDAVQNDKKLVKKIVAEYLAGMKPLQPIWEQKRILSLPQLKEFLDTWRGVWPWFEALWWLVELGPKKLGKDNWQLARNVRRTTETSGATNGVILRAVRTAYPTITPYADVLLIDEIFSGDIPSEAALKKRLQHYIYLPGKLLVDKSLADVESAYNITIKQPKVIKTNTIKGRTAYPGLVSGKVFRLMSRPQVSAFPAGAVLVTPMTTPDFLPAMHKAAAFVTDEGGLMSHAAIMARELKVPCVIATKVATRVLKNGDMVEVDATQGIVKKL